MRTADSRLCSLAVWLLVLVTVPAEAVGQNSDTVTAPPATILGQVVDSTGAALSDAEIVVRARDSVIVATAKSNSRGNFTFHNVPSGGPYLVTGRKLGYRPARGRNMYFKGGDTLRLRLVLNPLVVVLDPVVVKGRRSRYRIGVGEFNPKHFPDALSLIAWKRPNMLGDPEWCPLPDSFGLPKHDRLRIKITDRLMFYTGERPSGASPSQRPWIQAIRFPTGFEIPSSPYVRGLYVNGSRVDVPGDMLRTPLRLLREIPTKYIDHMSYVDCWDQSMPLGMQYSLFVVLKPLPPAVQDSVFRFMFAGASTPLIDGRLLAVERPSREFWDSLVQFLQGQDSVDSRRK